MRPQSQGFATVSGANSRPQKTPLSHGLTGLAAIKPGAKDVSQPAVRLAAFQTQRQMPGPARATGHERPGDSPVKVWLWAQKVQKARAGEGPKWRSSLFFQEQIKGLKNAPIAQFDGLRCYQSRSEKAPDFSTRAEAEPARANAGLRSVDRCKNQFAARRCAANLPRSHRRLFSACLLCSQRPIHCKNRSK